MKPTYRYLFTGIRLSLEERDGYAGNLLREKMKRRGFTPHTLHFRLYRKSIDARRKNDIHFVCSVIAEGEDRIPNGILQELCGREEAAEEIRPIYGREKFSARPLVVGMGPCGLFAALLLAENGYRPILIDRGGTVEERAKDTLLFRNTGKLDPESNIQFGAGGAGTFSDGKLITRIHDPRCDFVLETLHRFGAPDSILTDAKPHVGTDLLQGVVKNMLAEIGRLGGELHYHCRMDGFERNADGSLTVKTTCGDIKAGAMILAPGHSSRDTYFGLVKRGWMLEPKPISVGVRVEHLQADIDEALYGDFAGHPNLGHGEYSLSDTTGDRGVYTFCMCPGGEVAAASSEEGMLCVNGMSNHARDGRNANSAVAVSVYPTDIEPIEGNQVLGAIAFQRKIERAAYLAGGGDYVAPIMTLGDFLNGACGTEPSGILPSYGGGRVKVADFETVFPKFVRDGLMRGFRSFGKRISGYDTPDAVLTAAETRTSAPLRILRDAGTMTAVSDDLVYPAGEGAGYAGGITSAGVDGIRSALALMARFAPMEKVGGESK